MGITWSNCTIALTWVYNYRYKHVFLSLSLNSVNYVHFFYTPFLCDVVDPGTVPGVEDPYRSCAITGTTPRHRWPVHGSSSSPHVSWCLKGKWLFYLYFSLLFTWSNFTSSLITGSCVVCLHSGSLLIPSHISWVEWSRAGVMYFLKKFSCCILCTLVQLNFVKAKFIKTNNSLRRSKSSVPNRVLLILTKIQLFKSKYLCRIFYVSKHILRSRSGVFFIKSNG